MEFNSGFKGLNVTLEEPDFIHWYICFAKWSVIS